MKTFSSFIELIENGVIPIKKNNPEWIRIDGQTQKGNRSVFAYFNYKGNKWRINSDTHIDKLMKAYYCFIKGDDPFIEIPTRNLSNKCLVLKDEIENRNKHIYIYLTK
ncbi:MAG: hypothetical protein R2771_13060 [Saprospiraceae bacterium]